MQFDDKKREGVLVAKKKEPELEARIILLANELRSQGERNEEPPEKVH